MNFVENCPRQVLDFTDNMHEIQFRLGLCPRLGWGSASDRAGGAHSVPPDPLAGFEVGKGDGEKRGNERREIKG